MAFQLIGRVVIKNINISINKAKVDDAFFLLSCG